MLPNFLGNPRTGSMFHFRGSANIQIKSLKVFFAFVHSLVWQVGVQHRTSYIELAVLFHTQGFGLEACTADNITFRDLSFWLRHMFVYIGKLDSHGPFSGRTCLQTHKSEGRTFPQGAILDAVPFFSQEELLGLARMMDAGCSKNIASWEVPLHSPS